MVYSISFDMGMAIHGLGGVDVSTARYFLKRSLFLG
jgi:hypothetical protein